MVICLERDADLHMAQLMPLPLSVSCFSKIQIGFTFLVPAHPGSPGKRAVKWVCACILDNWSRCWCACQCVYQEDDGRVAEQRDRCGQLAFVAAAERRRRLVGQLAKTQPIKRPLHHLRVAAPPADAAQNMGISVTHAHTFV